MMDYCKVYNIAGIKIGIETNHQIQNSTGFLPFYVDECPNYRIQFEEVPELAVSDEWKVLYKGRVYWSFRDSEGNFIRLFKDELHNMGFYAYSRIDWKNTKIVVRYLAKAKTFFKESRHCFFYTSWEKILLREGRLILHASCVDTKIGGILFAGPSGIGKSTQAKLWCKYDDAKLINGDRPIITHSNGEWYAHGSPYAGSSRYYVNKKCHVRMLFFLQQGKECSIRSLSKVEAFQKVYTGIVLDTGDMRDVQMAVDIIEILISKIQVYEFSCTPDKNAVDYVKKWYKGEAG